MLKEKLMKFTGRTMLKVQKNKPEILIATGVVSFVGTVVMASKATLKVDEILEDHKDTVVKIKDFNEMNEDPETYSDKDYQKDLFITYTQTTLEFAKAYAPAVAMGVISISCFLTAHNIMKQRNIAIAAAYSALDRSFKNYRKRVVDTYGQEIDRNFKHGISNKSITAVDDNGVTVDKDVEVIENNGTSDYAVVFNEMTSKMWSRSPGGNLLFLKYNQEHANNVLKQRGHVFLNEVYEWLGMEHTQAGSVVGWARDNGDEFIDFGLYELNNVDDIYDSYKRDRDVVLDFNVDGVVYDLI